MNIRKRELDLTILKLSNLDKKSVYYFYQNWRDEMNNPSIKIIVVSGKAQHGKDTTANLLYEELTNRGKRVLITHYGDLVKYICRSFFGWDGEKDITGRTLLQYVGTDVVRKERPDYWVEFILDIINLFGDNWDYVIIPDTRFPNEINVLKSQYDNVTHIRVHRPGFDSGLTEEQLNHPSEIALDNTTPDIDIYNLGTIDGLREIVNFYIQEGVFE